ncbi:MAG: ATP-binding protein [Planctomycetota bacterium]|nr:ATP-binding protein [Planctomycetota bacterium]
MTSDLRAQRIQLQVRVQIEEPGGKEYLGITHDFSTTGFSAFLRCKEDFVVSEVMSNAFVQINFEKLESLFYDRKFRTVLNLENESIPPLVCSVVRVENSWLRGFEVFVACRFKDLDESNRQNLEAHIQNQLESGAVGYDEVDLPVSDDDLQGEVIRLELPARHMYIAYFRDFCEKLARDVGFSESNAFKIKVAADEVFSNAFEHGSPSYGGNKIQAKITTNRDGMHVRVRDQAGVPFDVTRYQDTLAVDETQRRSGLHLLSEFTDGWWVKTEQGMYTEISFQKNRKSRGHESDGRSEPRTDS